MQTTRTTPQMLAAQMSEAFITDTRADGSRFYMLREGSPEWMTQDVVFPAHGDMLPEDWRYKFIQEAVLALSDVDQDADEDDMSDRLLEAADADIYTHDRLRWLASHLDRPAYCDEAMSEFGPDAVTGITDLIGLGQMYERREVYELVLQALIDHAETIADENTCPNCGRSALDEPGDACDECGAHQS